MSFKKQIKSILLISGITALLTILVIVGLNIYIHLNTRSKIISNADELPASYCAIVLGAKVKENGALSNILKDRLQTALELYRMGKIKRFLLSGDHGRPTYDEVNAMKRFLQQHHVPDSVLFLDHAGFDTYNSMCRAKKIFQVTDAIVITQDFHLRRAVFTANQMGIDAIGFPSDKRLYESRHYLRIREYMANVKALYEIAIDKKPTFEGPPIPITGDSRRTFD